MYLARCTCIRRAVGRVPFQVYSIPKCIGLFVSPPVVTMICTMRTFFVAVFVVVCTCGNTNASIWPQPLLETVDSSSPRTPLASTFQFKTSSTSKVLQTAFTRYLELINPSPSNASEAGTMDASMSILTVQVKDDGDMLSFGVDESYTLSIVASDATLSANTVFGAMRGIESFVQLAVSSNKSIPTSLPNTVSIYDKPRFSYRGVMMDYSRHFYPIDFIKHTMEAMEACKLNVLHMHITDDQSFPIVSKSVPQLTEKGSYGPQYQYTHADINDLTTFANDRGIHLIPEFDMPAHSSSWKAGVPEMMANGDACSPKPFTHGDTMDPTVDITYDTLDKFLGEMIDLFPPPFLHLGGDEVPDTCWLSDSRIVSWMKNNSIADANALESYFVNKVATLPNVVKGKRTLVYWEEIFNNNVVLPADTIIQGWKSGAVGGVIARGHRATNSFGWYLNHGCNNYGDGVWTEFYVNDPLKYAFKNATEAEKELIIGGEVTMWGECVDAINFDGVVWPRTAGAAEQLWSPSNFTLANSTIPDATYIRLAEHRCRLLSRGIESAPLDSSSRPREVNPGCQ
eukprot:m.29055 g.29055  ORF g.29055 m.29055 type:complete len:569 (-) comp16032_c0_seq1:22-1728(-)